MHTGGKLQRKWTCLEEGKGITSLSGVQGDERLGIQNTGQKLLYNREVWGNAAVG